MYRLTAFPASDGDCLLLSWGEVAPYRHMLVDGGRSGAYRKLEPELRRIAASGEAIDLLILSHIDADHIEGLLKLLGERPAPVMVREVWYNGFNQMDQIERLGPRQGDQFSTLLRGSGWAWNTAFSGKAVVVDPNGRNQLTVGGLTLTLVSPDDSKLRAMRREWAKWRTNAAAKRSQVERSSLPLGIERLGPKPMPPVLDVDMLAAAVSPIDDEEPNGSSIAVVAEYGAKRVLLAADAHPDLLERTIAPIAAQEGGRFRLDVYKVSHHGSRGNTTRRLIEMLDCRRFLISTNGSRHGHPDPQAIAQLIKYAPQGERTIYFNYKSNWTAPWGDPQLTSAHGYKAEYPSETPGLITIEI